MKLKLYMNELGLLKTEDGKWSIRYVNGSSWAVQYRDNPTDPWDWKVVDYYRTKEIATQYVFTNMQRDHNNAPE